MAAPIARPMLFSAPMIRALLSGAKTQTRRVLKPQPPNLGRDYEREWHAHVVGPGGSIPEEWSWWEGPPHGPSVYHRQRVPYAPGDHLWCRETWRADDYDDRQAIYRADFPHFTEDDLRCVRWRPSIHMPRWASRLTLTVTDVRVQRVQEISDEDAEAEGLLCAETEDGDLMWSGTHWSYPVPAEHLQHYPALAFRDLWDSLNAKRGFGWDTNPWVVAISFRVHRCNIDSMAGDE